MQGGVACLMMGKLLLVVTNEQAEVQDFMKITDPFRRNHRTYPNSTKKN
jgi:hypothetical protein